MATLQKRKQSELEKNKLNNTSATQKENYQDGFKKAKIVVKNGKLESEWEVLTPFSRFLLLKIVYVLLISF